MARDTAEARVSEADEHWRAAEAEVSRWRARAEALDLSLGAVRAAGGAAELDGIAGIEGPLVDHLEIEPGAEAAVASALGDAMRAVVVGSGDAARRALHRLADGDAHTLLLVVDTAHGDATQGEFVPSGSRALLDCVRARLPGLQPVLAHLLARTVLVETGWEEALDLALAHQGLVVVTPAGDRFGGLGPWRVGGERGAGVTQARARRGRRARNHRGAAPRGNRDRGDRGAATLATARARAVTADEARRQAQADLDQRRAAATMLRRDLEVRAAAIEERRVVLARRLEEVERRLAARDPEAQATAERRRSGLVERAAAYEHLSGAIARHLAAVDTLHERLGERRRRQSEAARTSGEQLDVLRGERATLEEQLAGVREPPAAPRSTARRRSFGSKPRSRSSAPSSTVRPPSHSMHPSPTCPKAPRSRAARELDRELRLMGPINPLALQEHDALQERHEFLQQQLEDVKQSRRELHRVIKAVDREIIMVFQAAWDDVSRHFTALFSTLFPGGGGMLSLTDPDDLLNTGIEIEARPSGKNVRRLSLLSGGERSLTALAYLFAVFRARPSPFYLLDEVEAALDDVNLHRFLDLVHEFRGEAQLVVVSHQKRTMEAADCLYGVSMPPGGSSRVVSQRITGDLVHDEIVLS